ncbi:MAG: IclR family transcriptional regulator [Rubrivivax sp.]
MTDKTPPDVARTSLRALDVLQAFRDTGRPLALSELARRTDIPVSTCHGLLKRLAEEGWIFHVTAREFYPTRRLWTLAEELRRQDPILQPIEPALRALRDEVGETLVVGLREGDLVRLLMVLEARHEIRYTALVGTVRPIHAGSMGKVYLAALPAAEFAAWMSGRTLQGYTARTLVTEAALREDLDDGLLRGYQRVLGEYNADGMALAVPLKLGEVRLAVAVAGPAARMLPIEALLAHRLTRGVRQLQHSLEA